jgi:hypothetical protein
MSHRGLYDPSTIETVLTPIPYEVDAPYQETDVDTSLVIASLTVIPTVDGDLEEVNDVEDTGEDTEEECDAHAFNNDERSESD